jgi:tRNA pseudouridine38-40 synthase
MSTDEPSPAVRNFRLVVAYNGAAYEGWQRQASAPTLQAALETAVAKVIGQPAHVQGSGRTDAGVHALGQVAAFRAATHLTPDVLRRALNAELPRDIAVLEVAEAAADFHPTRDARRKRYRYVIHDGPVRDVFRRGYCWEYRYGRLDAAAMQRAAAALLGTHDFSSFQTTGAPRRTSVRTIFVLEVRRSRAGERGRILFPECDAPAIGNAARSTVGNELRAVSPAAEGVPSTPGQGRAGEQATASLASLRADPPVEQSGDFITIEIEANGFLYNMVRAIVGTLVEVGRGRQPETWPGEVLAARDRRTAGPNAPAEGLFLVKVDYGS